MTIVAALVLLGLVWVELKRPVKAFLFLRILATVMAVVALYLLMMPFPFWGSEKGKKAIIVLAEGYHQDSVKQFLKKEQHEIPQYDLNNVSNELLNDVSTIHLFGNGFKDTDQVDLPKVPILFHATDQQTGVQNIHWQHNLISGSTLLVQGSCLNLKNKPLKLILYGWNQRIDSIEIGVGKLQQFSFAVQPENIGRGIYRLALVAGKDSIEKETIAYQVQLAKALKVLMLGASPDFESKFLKNWLADFGYTVISKTSVSKEKFQQTYSNAGQLKFEKLTTALLDEQDLIITDEAAIQALPSSELGLLKEAIAAKGIGLILNADSAISKKNFIGELVTVRSADSNKVSIKVSKLGESNSAASINLKHPYQIIDQKGMQPLFLDQQKRIFAAVTVFGKGKLLVNTLQKTSTWLLAANKNDYRNYWTALIDQVAKKESAIETWTSSTDLPRADEAIRFTAQTNSSSVPQLSIQHQEIAAKQNALLPSNWEAIYWSGEAGWQTMIGTNGTISDWYLYPKESWKTIYASKQISKTRDYLKNRVSNTGAKDGELRKASPIQPIYLFLIFLLSMAFLWVERKFQ